jgi:stage V sporulation protein K
MHGSATAKQARALLFRVSNVIAKADGRVTQREEKLLENLREKLWTSVIEISPASPNDSALPPAPTPARVTTTDPSSRETARHCDEPTVEELLQQLNSLVGLASVKREVEELVNFLRIQEVRRTRGLPVVSLSQHLVFAGNPGTGETTIARLIASIYRALGIVSKGHLVETDRSGLVARYVGQTAIKTRQIAESALGGVLFIDEAYALAGREGDSGTEAIEILLKFMEDHRNDFVVIVAGYPARMQAFLEANPGLRYRFNRQLHFDNYSQEELLEIFELLCHQATYSIAPQTREKIRTLLADAVGKADDAFGNARFVRNLFEDSLRNQATRLVHLTDIGLTTLTTLEPEDISNS